MGLELLEPLLPQSGCVELGAGTTSRRLGPSPVSEESIRSQVLLRFESIDQLREYRIENFDIGYAVLSSLVSLCRDPEPDLIRYQVEIERFLIAALQTYRHTQSFIDEYRPDRVYVFNGRFAAMRAVLRAAQSRGVECCLHERGCDNQHYDVLTNHMSHDLPAMQEVIRRHWEAADGNAQRLALAETWYQERVQRVERNWHSFVKHQQVGELPTGWNPKKKNITVFCSSDDEFAAIGDFWNNKLYPDQGEAIRRIVTDLLPHPDINLTLRMHPNLKGLTHQGIKAMLNLKSANLNVLPPESTVDSYTLLKASDCVVTFGSTVGIEAVYWQRPSVLLGPAFYQDLGGTYQPTTHIETLQLLKQNLAVQSRQGALMYGFWLQTFGIPFEYFQASGLFDGTFKGHVLYARPGKKTLLTRVKNKLKKVSQLFELV
jgi:hypothetical protein